MMYGLILSNQSRKEINIGQPIFFNSQWEYACFFCSVEASLTIWLKVSDLFWYILEQQLFVSWNLSIVHMLQEFRKIAVIYCSYILNILCFSAIRQNSNNLSLSNTFVTKDCLESLNFWCGLHNNVTLLAGLSICTSIVSHMFRWDYRRKQWLQDQRHWNREAIGRPEGRDAGMWEI